MRRDAIVSGRRFWESFAEPIPIPILSASNV